MPLTRPHRVALVVLMISIVTACGGDDPYQDAVVYEGDSSGVPVDDPVDDSAALTTTSLVTGSGTLTLGEETVSIESTRCDLEAHDLGGRRVDATAQGFGTTAEGDQIAIDFIRFSASDIPPGESITVTVGDAFAGVARGFAAIVPVDTVLISGDELSAAEVLLLDESLGTDIAASFDLSC